MGLTEKEKKELKREMREKYKGLHGWEKGVTLGDISDDMHHSDKREIADVNQEIVREEK